MNLAVHAHINEFLMQCSCKKIIKSIHQISTAFLLNKLMNRKINCRKYIPWLALHHCHGKHNLDNGHWIFWNIENVLFWTYYTHMISLIIIQSNLYQKQNKMRTNCCKKVLFLFVHTACNITVLGQSAQSTYNHGSRSCFSWTTINWMVQCNATWTKFKPQNSDN